MAENELIYHTRAVGPNDQQAADVTGKLNQDLDGVARLADKESLRQALLEAVAEIEGVEAGSSAGDAARGASLVADLTSVAERISALKQVDARVTLMELLREYIARAGQQRHLRHVNYLPASEDSNADQGQSQPAQQQQPNPFRDIVQLYSSDPSKDSAKRFHQGIIDASQSLGEAAQRRDEVDQKEAQEAWMSERNSEAKIAREVQRIDNLSNTSNGKTPEIINKIGGPFGLSLEEALRLAMEAEQAEQFEEAQQVVLSQPINSGQASPPRSSDETLDATLAV